MDIKDLYSKNGILVKNNSVEASSFAINVIGSKSDKLYINKLPTDKKVN
jgi:hypothetical protein